MTKPPPLRRRTAPGDVADHLPETAEEQTEADELIEPAIIEKRSAGSGSRSPSRPLKVGDEILVQVSYAIGVANPMGIYISTFGTANIDMPDGEIASIVSTLFDMRPAQ